MKYHINWVKEQFDKEEKMKFIFFWGHRKKKDGSIGQSCFSQWWEQTFEVDGHSYPSAEHWMMAGKARLFKDSAILEQIYSADSPGAAKALGRKVKNFDPATWEAHRYGIVCQGNLHKFQQHESLKNYLLNTNDRILVEASPVDPIWGIGMAATEDQITNPHSWKGLNLLGFALMEVRDLLRQA